MIRFGKFTLELIGALWQPLDPMPPIRVMISLMQQLDIMVQLSDQMLVVPCMIRLSCDSDAYRFKVRDQHAKRVALKMELFPCHAFHRLSVQISKHPMFSRATFGKDALAIEFKTDNHKHVGQQLCDSSNDGGGEDSCAVVLHSPTTCLLTHNGHITRSVLLRIEVSNRMCWHDAVQAIRDAVINTFQQISNVSMVVECPCDMCSEHSSSSNSAERTVYDLRQRKTISRSVRCPISHEQATIITIPASRRTIEQLPPTMPDSERMLSSTTLGAVSQWLSLTDIDAGRLLAWLVGCGDGAALSSLKLSELYKIAEQIPPEHHRFLAQFDATIDNLKGEGELPVSTLYRYLCKLRQEDQTSIGALRHALAECGKHIVANELL
jgi:hypothetical protein